MNHFLSKQMKIWNRRLSDYEFKRRKRILYSRPWSVQLDVTTCCNLKCVMCLREQCYCKGHHMSLDLPMTEITVSMDSGNSKTLQEIRRNLNTDKFMNNVTFLAGYRRKKGVGPKLNINSVLLKPNVKDLPALVRLVAGLGFHSIGVSTPFGFNEQSPADIRSMLLSAEDGPELKRILNESRAVAKDSGISFTFVSDTPELDVPARIFDGNPEQGYPPNQLPELSVDGKIREPFPSQQPNFRCEAPWVFTNIDPNGKMRACCQTAGYNLGSLTETSFFNAWNSSRYQALRDGLAKRAMYSICHEKLCYYIPGSTHYDGPDSDAPGSLDYRWISGKTEFRGSMGEIMKIPVAMENTGDTLWRSTLIHSEGAGRVNIAHRYRKIPAPFPSFDEGDRMYLPYDVLPGDSVFFEVPFTVPPEPGEYEVQFTLVDEMIRWFDASEQQVRESTIRISVS